MDSHELFVEQKFKEVSKLIPENSKILDVGCGDGKIRNFVQNCDYFGIDGQKKLVDSLIEENVKAKTIDLNKEKFPFEKEKFDYILMLDILEHVADPKQLLDQAKSRLNERGRIIVTLPNDYHILNKIRFLFNKHLTEDAFAPYGHLHYFPIKSGANFLKKNGFKIEKKIILPPTKPNWLPKSIKSFLAQIFPQAFARDVLYLLEPLP